MLLKSAEVSHFRCEEFEVWFPAAEAAPIAPPTAIIPPARRGVVGTEESPRDNYALLFPGGKPTLADKRGA